MKYRIISETEARETEKTNGEPSCESTHPGKIYDILVSMKVSEVLDLLKQDG